MDAAEEVCRRLVAAIHKASKRLGEGLKVWQRHLATFTAYMPRGGGTAALIQSQLLCPKQCRAVPAHLIHAPQLVDLHTR